MKKIVIACVVLMGITVGCQKDGELSKNSSSSTELNVPASFDWSVSQYVTVDLASVEPGEVSKAVQVYSEGNLLLTKKLNGTNEVVVNVPKHVDALDVVADGKLYTAMIFNGSAVAKLKPIKKSGGCACDGKMQNFTVIYSGPDGATVDAAKRGKRNSRNSFQTFTNVDNGDTLKVIGNGKHGRLDAQTFIRVNGGSYYNVHTSCSEDILGNVYGPFTVIAYTDGNGASCNQGSTPPPPTSADCDCEGRMRNFTVIYTGNNNATVTASAKVKRNKNYVFQTDNSVNSGDTLVIVGFDKHGRLKSKTTLSTNGSRYSIHTSCSEDILGNTYGPFYVIAYTDGQGVSCGIPPQCIDTDGDGCCDPDDAFPNDPSKCDELYVPSDTTYATVAYEDLWPFLGDFDFNDLVVDRNTTYSLDVNGDVTELHYVIVTKAAGAKQNNGFGLAFPQLLPSDIASVTGDENPQGYTVKEVNGTEAGQDFAVVVLYENWKSIVTQGNPGAYFNTVKGGGTGDGDPDTMKVDIVLSSPQPVTAIDWDPFLIRDGVRNREIHLPNRGPTKLSQVSDFGTGDDASAYPNAGNNYVTADNIPWAIEIPNRAFNYPVEFADIRTAYFDFAAWANSGGTLFTDWYENGNNDPSKIY